MKLRKLCTVLLVVGVSALYLPAANAGAVVTWKLTSSDIPSQYLPSSVSSTGSGISSTGSGGNTGSSGNTGSGGNALTDIGGAASCISFDQSFTSSCLENVKNDMVPPGTTLIAYFAGNTQVYNTEGEEKFVPAVLVQSNTGASAMISSVDPLTMDMRFSLFPHGEYPSASENSVLCRRDGGGDNDYSACPSGSYATVKDANGNPDKLILVP